MATCLITDFIKPYEKVFQKIVCFKMGEKFYTILGKAVSIVFGILCILMAYVAALAGEGVLQAALSLMGMLGGKTRILLLLLLMQTFFRIVKYFCDFLLAFRVKTHFQSGKYKRHF